MINGFAILLIFPILVMTLVSSVLHYRKGSQLERRQIKWLAMFAGSIALYILLGLMVYPLLTGGQMMNGGNNPITMFSYLIPGLFPPFAIGVAVLRHRLWDIDLIIRRTLVYSILTVILTLIYFGTVAGLQSLFTTVIGHQSPAAIVLSTWPSPHPSPLRKRIQYGSSPLYRQKYDAERVLAAFSTTLRK
jgi:hypothetical protein